MPIKLARIDDRLIHGQVTVGWTRLLGIDRILVVSDKVAKDPIQQAVLGMAAPHGVKVSPVTVADAICKLTTTDLVAKSSLMLIFTNPTDVLALVNAGVEIQEVNIGGMQFKTGKTQVTKAVSVDAADVSAFKELHDRGIKLSVQMVPADKPTDLWPQLEHLTGR